MSRIILVCFTILLSACAVYPPQERDIFLLRHAEKQQDKADPGLTTAGLARAARVAQLLHNHNVKHVFSSDYLRTRQTAKVIADRNGVPVTLYDARQSQQLIDRLSKVAGNLVIVGHSNTIPELVTLLGGSAGPAIHESEYGRLYRLRLGAHVSTELLNSDP